MPKLTNGPGIRTVGDEELRTVRGGKDPWYSRAYAWIKNHVTGSRNSIGYKGEF